MRDLQTGETRLLTRDGGEQSFAFHVIFSPDGKQIAASYWYAYPGGDRTRGIVLILTADGSITRLKSTGRMPNIGGFSPDGRFLTYALPNSQSKTDGGIFAIAVDGSGETPLVQSLAA